MMDQWELKKQMHAQASICTPHFDTQEFVIQMSVKESNKKGKLHFFL